MKAVARFVALALGATGAYVAHARLAPAAITPTSSFPSPRIIPLADAPDDRLDLNSASQKELEDLPGIDEDMAKRIIEHRPYKSVNDLGKADISAREIAIIGPLVQAKPPKDKGGQKKSTTRE